MSTPAAEDDAATPGAGRRWTLVATALAGVPVASFLWTALHRVGYPYELEWMEGGAVEITRRVVAGQSLYTAPTLEFTPWPYPPLYFWVSAAVTEVVGTGYLAGRIVSLAAAVAVLVLLALLARRSTGSSLAAAVAAGGYAATYYATDTWADVGRVDSLVLALVLAAGVAADRARGVRGGLLVAVLLLLAVLTKQLALLPGIALLGWLLLARRRAGVAATCGSTLGLAAIAVLGSVRTDGWFLEYLLWELPGHDLVAERITGFWVGDIGVPMLPLLVVAVVAVGAAVRRGRVRAGSDPAPGRTRPPLPMREWIGGRGWVARGVAPWLAVGLLLAAWVGRVHTGGAVNVLMPGYAGVSLLAAGAAAYLARRGLSALVVAALAVQVAVLARDPGDGIPDERDERAGQELVALLAGLPGRVVALDHPYALTQAGKPSTSHRVAVTDVLTGGSQRAREALEADLPVSLREVSAVVTVWPDETDVFGPGFEDDAVRVAVLDGAGQDGEAPGVVIGLDRRPGYVHLRRGLDAEEVSAP